MEAVRGVDLAVDTGEIFAFLGPNGAGKSTMVRMLTTLLSITSGRAEVAGVDVVRDPDSARRRIGVALQEAGLDPRQTGRELLNLHGRLFGFSADRARERAQELLELVELEEAADRRSRATRVAWVAASTSRRRSCTSPRSCSSTSRPRDWTRRAA